MSIIREFVRQPRMTGAIAKSSPRLAKAVTTGLGLADAGLVVEIGPGTGAFTDAILPLLAPGARLIAVELNPALAVPLAHRYRGQPVDVVNADAAQLAEIVPGPVDAVVSGLPWAVFPGNQQERILDAITSVLTGKGTFATFAYLHACWAPPATQFTRRLEERFEVTEKSRTVWRNLPPAFVHRAARPRGGAPSPALPTQRAAPEAPGRADAVGQ
jgi:phosphatidylethanolamine/phosphatidyl-N-methylethanolamine N-methyltransferase